MGSLPMAGGRRFIEGAMPRQIAAERKLAAEAAFVRAAWAALPVHARRALFTIPPEAVDEWARDLRVDAPCMIRCARHYQELAASADPNERLAERLSEATVSIDESVGARRPDEWMTELRRLDAQPISVWRQTLEDRDQYPEDYRRAGLADDDDFLAPVSADPSWETKRHFLRRAEDHFLARQHRVRRVEASTGFTIGPSVATPQLNQHVGWLVRFQIGGESTAQIAKSAGLHQPNARVTVNKATRALARLLGLRLRPTPAGRPRTSKRKPARSLGCFIYRAPRSVS